MQIVIEIPESIYDTIQSDEMISREQLAILQMHIMNGIQLPKGHGRLIDADYLKDVILLHNFHGNNKNIVPYSDRRGYRLRQREVDEAIINAPTIIEADGGDTETWNGYHGQVTAPKGTFKRIYADADGGDAQEETDD